MKKVKLSDLGSLVSNKQQVEQKATINFPGMGWIRIGEFERDRWGSVLLSLANTTAVLSGRSLLINVINATTPTIATVATIAGQVFTKGRVIKENNISYLEIYYGNSASIQARVIASSIIEFNLYQSGLPGNVPSGQSPTEFTF